MLLPLLEHPRFSASIPARASPLLPFVFLSFLLLLPDGIESLSLRLHPDVALVPEHLAGHVAGDLHDGLIAGAALSEFRNQRMS